MSDIVAISRRLDEIELMLERLRKIDLGGVPTPYTPTYLGASVAGATTYTTQVGFYTRFGRLIIFNGRVIWTAATGTGTAVISIPLTSQNTTDMRYSLAIYSSGLTFANNNVVGLIGPNAAGFSMQSLLTNAAPTAVAVEAAGDVIFAGLYYI